MRYGMTLPKMAAQYGPSTTADWSRRIEAGPYASLSVGERITFRNQEQMVTLGAAAALTDRVRLVSTITVLPMHPVAIVAKQAATLDVLSAGRLTLGLGVGGRQVDYRAGDSPYDHRLQRLDDKVLQLRQLWAGQPPATGGDPVGPVPVQQGGPPLLCSAMGPKSLARSARWANGYAGFTLAADPTELRDTAERVRDAWRGAGRLEPPYLMTSFWFSLGPDAEARHQQYVGDYMAVEPTARDYMVSTACLWDDHAVGEAIEAVRSAGYDELMFVPTTTDLVELDRLERLL